MKRRLDWALLAAAATVFLAISVAYYPPMYLASDEAGNLALSQVLAEGTPFGDVADCHLPTHVQARNGHSASRYPPGLAGLLLPFTVIDLRAAFALPLIAHFLIFGIAALMLERARLSPLWALLYLCYPTAVLHSRTLMSNLPAAALLFAAFGLLVRNSRSCALLAGVLVGLGVLVRQPLILGGLILGLGVAWRERRALLAVNWPQRLLTRPSLFALGVLPGVVLYLMYHWYVFGSPLMTGYQKVGDLGRFGMPAVLSCLPRYALILLTIYPLMLITPFIYKGKWKLEILSVPLVYLVFYGSYSWFDAGDTFAQTLVRAPRFLLPAAPFLIIAYAHSLSSCLQRIARLERILLHASGVVGLVAAGYVCHRHYEVQLQQAAVRDALYATTTENSTIICDIEGAELLQEAWGRRVVMDFRALDLDEVEVLITSGEKVYMAGVSKPSKPIFRVWQQAVLEELRRDGRFQLSGGQQPAKRWRLYTWQVQAGGE